MKKAYITWDDNDMESSEDLENKEIKENQKKGKETKQKNK